MSKLLLLVAALCLAAAGAARSRPPEPAGDTDSLDGILAATYASISGAAGEERDWDRFRSLFHPGGARLMAVGRDAEGRTLLRVRTPDEYVEGASGYFATNAFYEREVARRVERFGHIAHVFSTYESLREPGGEPFTRGINSLQLLWDEERWWILSILWDEESEAQPIPVEYLVSEGAAR